MDLDRKSERARKRSVKTEKQAHIINIIDDALYHSAVGEDLS